MPAAVAIPLITSAATAGTQLIGAKMASNSAKNAAKTQEASANKAIDLQRQIYGQQEQRLSPFVSAGQQAVQSLGQLGQQRAPMFNAQQPGGGFTPQSLGQMGQKPMGGMVNMRGPDGRVRPVPAHMVDQAKAMGGQIV